METKSSPLHNRILAALPDADYTRLLPHLEVSELPLGASLYESGAKQSYVYFPI